MDITIAVGTAAALVTVSAAVRATWSPCGLSMISSMNSLAERGRGHRFPVTAALFIVAATCGGLLVGLVAAGGAAVFALVPHPSEVGALLGVAAGAVAFAADLPGSRLRLPVHPRQVDESWLTRYRRWVYATGFGVQIGSGFATYIMSAATYLVPVLGVLTGRPQLALALGGGFGLIRGLAVLVGSRVRSTEDLVDRTRMLDRLERFSMWPVWGAEVAAIALLLVALPAGWTLPTTAAVLVVLLVIARPGREYVGRVHWPASREARRSAAPDIPVPARTAVPAGRSA